MFLISLGFSAILSEWKIFKEDFTTVKEDLTMHHFYKKEISFPIQMLKHGRWPIFEFNWHIYR